MLYQTIQRQMRSELFPALPETVASEELIKCEVYPNHVQVEKAVQKNGTVIKRILPILIKEEPDKEHITKEPSLLMPYQLLLPPDAQPEELLCENALLSYSEEETDGVEYVSDEKPDKMETDSSAAESMEEELTKVDVQEFNTVLETISSGLKQAAEGYDNLQTLLPRLPVHKVLQVAETIPAIYTKPLPPQLISMLTEMGPKEVMYQVIRHKVAKGTPVRQLWNSYRLTRSMTSRALTGEGYKGGSWYQCHKAEASTAEKEDGDVEDPPRKRQRKCKKVVKKEEDP